MTYKLKKKIGYGALIAIALLVLGWLFISAPIPQDEHYHNFSDQDTLLGIPHFWNVISNLPFLIAGLYGMIAFRRNGQLNSGYLIFFIGIGLVAFGSGYYHYAPTSNTLVWDRLPMTIAFTALVAIITREFIDQKIGQALLIPLVGLGLLSILYWIQYDDLRFYAIVQFYPILAIPFVLVFFKKEHQKTKQYWYLLVFMAWRKYSST